RLPIMVSNSIGSFPPRVACISASDYVSFSRDHLCDFHIFRPAGLFFKCSLVANGLWAPARAGRGRAHLAWRKRPLGGEIRQLMAATLAPQIGSRQVLKVYSLFSA